MSRSGKRRGVYALRDRRALIVVHAVMVAAGEYARASLHERALSSWGTQGSPPLPIHPK